MRTTEHDEEIERLCRRGADLTRRIDRASDTRERNARERARVWEQAVELGASHYRIGDAAGLHHSAVGKALKRYGSNGDE